MNYLNVGCGSKFHTDWVNIDMSPSSADVISCNLLQGIPFPDNSFEVIYHSQVLEHFPKEKALGFIKECHRVLKPDGFLRVVVPDLENIIDEYNRLLKENIENPNLLSEANYDWILLEMYDQTVRNYSGGQMAEFLRQPDMINENYVINRIGYVGRSIRDGFLNELKLADASNKPVPDTGLFKTTLRSIYHKIRPRKTTEVSKVGSFRLSGEIHNWMYDRYSLSRLLMGCGFEDITVRNPFESNIPNWAEYELDVKDGLVYDPTSLFVEARKKEVLE